MNRRYHFIVLPALIAAVFVMFPGVSGADERPSGGMVEVPEAPGRLLELINAERAQAGLHPLASRNDVASIAVAFTRRMATEGRVWHNQDYLSALTLQQLTAVSVGENVSRTASVERAHVAFMESPVHRANILSPKFKIVGIGVVRDAANNVYVTQDFLTPVDLQAAIPAAPKAQPTRRVARPQHPGSSTQPRASRQRAAAKSATAATPAPPVTSPPAPLSSQSPAPSPSPAASPAPADAAPVTAPADAPSPSEAAVDAPPSPALDGLSPSPAAPGEVALDALPASSDRRPGALAVVLNPVFAVAGVLGLGLAAAAARRRRAAACS